MFIGKVVLYSIGYFLIFVSLLPLIRNDNWIFRVFEYPRAQKLLINVLVLVAFCFAIDWTNSHDLIFSGLMLSNIVYLSYLIWPYTFLARHQLKQGDVADAKNQFKLLILNVYQDNRDIESCVTCIKKHDPDILLLVETDRWWKEKLDAEFKDKYSYQIARPLDNTYGITMYSKLELIDPTIKFLVEKDIPSIHTKVRLPSGQVFQLYGLHPQPPVPQESSRSTERDAEILMVAKSAKSCKSPVIVAGDLNDVAWSYTTELFLKVSGLLDPRRGRGFYNTFHAHHWFLRWPLDHIFCSSHFHLRSLHRLPSVGSDHFPILVELVVMNEEAHDNQREELKADTQEEHQAKRKIEKVK